MSSASPRMSARGNSAQARRLTGVQRKIRGKLPPVTNAAAAAVAVATATATTTSLPKMQPDTEPTNSATAQSTEVAPFSPAEPVTSNSVPLGPGETKPDNTAPSTPAEAPPHADVATALPFSNEAHSNDDLEVPSFSAEEGSNADVNASSFPIEAPSNADLEADVASTTSSTETAPLSGELARGPKRFQLISVPYDRDTYIDCLEGIVSYKTETVDLLKRVFIYSSFVPPQVSWRSTVYPFLVVGVSFVQSFTARPRA